MEDVRPAEESAANRRRIPLAPRTGLEPSPYEVTNPPSLCDLTFVTSATFPGEIALLDGVMFL